MKNTFNMYNPNTEINGNYETKVSEQEMRNIGVFNYDSVWNEYYNAAADSADDYIDMMAD